jgi:hypothetical protein
MYVILAANNAIKLYTVKTLVTCMRITLCPAML